MLGLGLKFRNEWNKYFGWLNLIILCSFIKFIGFLESFDMIFIVNGFLVFI